MTDWSAKYQAVKLGDAATMTFGSDAYPGTVVAVKRALSSKKVTEIHVQHDDYRAVSGSGHDGSARYEITPNPKGRISIYKVRRNGDIGQQGQRLIIGERRAYHDPHI